jgi:hypothetical protein
MKRWQPSNFFNKIKLLKHNNNNNNNNNEYYEYCVNFKQDS